MPITLLIILVFGCQSKETTKEVPKTSVKNPNAGNTSKLQKNTDLTYTVADGWLQQQPSSSMRHDQYELPGPEGSDAATLAIFKGIGGSIDSNIDRWKKQFITPPNNPDSNLNSKKPRLSIKYPFILLPYKEHILSPECR